MKQFTLGIIAVSLLSAFVMAGCGNSDGPSLSDDELLKRGRAGHDTSTANANKPPTGQTGAAPSGQ